jgi:valyl-tRNA synthetase
VRFSWDKIEEGRSLAIKLWNVARLILQHGEGIDPALHPRALEERWILRRIDEARAEIERLLPRFEFAAVADLLYHLTFDDFCDWYAEAIKPRLYEDDPRTVETALGALERLLALLHPVLPHVTEEIWSQFHDSRLIVSRWPEPLAQERSADGALLRVQEAAAIFRRSGVLPALEGDEKRIFDAVVKPERTKRNGDVEAERARLQKEIARAEGMLANERFVQGAPDHVVAAEREKLDRYRRDLESIGG